MDQLVLLEVPAGDPHGHGGLTGRDDHPDPGMSAAPHGSTSGVNHEADQEPGNCFQRHFKFWLLKVIIFIVKYDTCWYFLRLS